MFAGAHRGMDRRVGGCIRVCACVPQLPKTGARRAIARLKTAESCARDYCYPFCNGLWSNVLIECYLRRCKSKSIGLITAVYRRELLPIRHLWLQELKILMIVLANINGSIQESDRKLYRSSAVDFYLLEKEFLNFCRELFVSDHKPIIWSFLGF